MAVCRLKCVNSSSEGNAFILECGDDILLLDLGVSFDKILKTLNYREGFEKVRGCLVTHL